MQFASYVVLALIILLRAGPAEECGRADLRLTLNDKNPQVVQTLEEHWMQAYASRDAALLGCLLADDFEISSIFDGNLELHNKQHVLEWVASRTGSAELERLQIKSHGTAVVARGVYSVRRGAKLVSRFQFADFFVYQDGRWQAIARTLAQLPVP